MILSGVRWLWHSSLYTLMKPLLSKMIHKIPSKADDDVNDHWSHASPWLLWYIISPAQQTIVLSQKSNPARSTFSELLWGVQFDYTSLQLGRVPNLRRALPAVVDGAEASDIRYRMSPERATLQVHCSNLNIMPNERCKMRSIQFFSSETIRLGVLTHLALFGWFFDTD